jgi:hypothetical protein
VARVAQAREVPAVEIAALLEQHIIRDGRTALLIGIAFLFACIVLRQLAFSFGRGAAAEIAGEGLLIVGWVAMWRPLEIFLYDWRPIRRRCQLFAKLSEIPVIVRAA